MQKIYLFIRFNHDCIYKCILSLRNSIKQKWFKFGAYLYNLLYFLIHFIPSKLRMHGEIEFITNSGYLLLSVIFVYTIFAYFVVYLNTSI